MCRWYKWRVGRGGGMVKYAFPVMLRSPEGRQGEELMVVVGAETEEDPWRAWNFVGDWWGWHEEPCHAATPTPPCKLF